MCCSGDGITFMWLDLKQKYRGCLSEDTLIAYDIQISLLDSGDLGTDDGIEKSRFCNGDGVEPENEKDS